MCQLNNYVNKHMKKLVFIILSIILVSCNTKKDANSEENLTENKIPFDTLNSKIIISDSVYSKRLNIEDMNTFLSFYQKKDTLFCISTYAILFYNQRSDKWMIYKLAKQKQDLMAKYNNQIGNDVVFQKEYSLSTYNHIISQHKNCFLISQADEGAECFKQEVVDTSAKVLYRFENESINDFYFDDKNLWICSDYKISKISKDSSERTDYLILPAAREIKAVVDFKDSCFYLDRYKGLYSCNKLNGQINPVIEINKYCYFENFNFFNAVLKDDKIYVAGVEMYMKSGWLKHENTSKALLFSYDLKTTEVKVFNTGIDFFDRFYIDADKLIAYGVWREVYEGGEIEYYGGAILYNTSDQSVKTILTEPIIGISKKGNTLKAENFEVFEDYLITEKYKFSMDYTVLNLDIDTFYYDSSLKDGDLHQFDKRYKINNTAYEKYSTQFKKIYNEEKLTPKSKLDNNKYNVRQLRIKNGKVLKQTY